MKPRSKTRTCLVLLVLLTGIPAGQAAAGSAALTARQSYQEGLYFQRSLGDLPAALERYDQAQESAIRADANQLLESILLRKSECFNLLGLTSEQNQVIARLRSRDAERDASLGEARFFPPENDLVFQIDLKTLLNSELLKSLKIEAEIKVEDLKKAQDLLGIDFLTDIHRLTVGLSLAENQKLPTQNWLVLMEGNLDGFQMDTVLKLQQDNNPEAKTSAQNIYGTKVNIIKTTFPGDTVPMTAGLAKLNDTGAVLAGDIRSVRAFLAARSGKLPGLRANPSLSHVARKVPKGTTLWLAAVPERVVAKLKNLENIPGLKNLPKLKGMLLTGQFDRDLTITGTAWAQDDQTARLLGDIVRGLVALVQFMPVEEPLVKKLLGSLQVQTSRHQVSVSATLSGELLAKKAAEKQRQDKNSGGQVELKLTKGRLTIDTAERMEVFIDDRQVGKTPMKRYPVRPGSHLLRLVSPSGKKVLSVKLEDNQDVIIKKNLPGLKTLKLTLPSELPPPHLRLPMFDKTELPEAPEAPEPDEPVGPQ